MFEVGDVVIAKDNNYVITRKSNNYIGVVKETREFDYDDIVLTTLFRKSSNGNSYINWENHSVRNEHFPVNNKHFIKVNSLEDLEGFGLPVLDKQMIQCYLNGVEYGKKKKKKKKKVTFKELINNEVV